MLCCRAGYGLPSGSVSEVSDTVLHHLDDLVVSATYKGSDTDLLQPLGNTTLTMPVLQNRGVDDIQELSGIIPNLHIPNYGSSMTSSIYIRGLGSRIDQPVMSMYVDDLPVMNKNAYDFDLLDISGISILRGPQNTLYGRGSMGGAIVVSTPPAQGIYTKAQVSYGTGNSVKGFVTHNFKRGVQLNVRGSYTNGLFTNSFDNSRCDKGYSAAGTLKYESGDTLKVKIRSITDASWLSQGGYPYRLINAETGHLEPINYNDPCGYERLTIRQGIILDWKAGRVSFNSATTYNYLRDEMTMDQDFTSRSMFTLKQKQSEHTVNEDFMVSGEKGIWQWLAGVNIFARFMDMDAPVTFKRDGIENLILANANRGIQHAFPDASLDIVEDNFTIFSSFNNKTVSIAAYHNSTLNAGRWWSFNIGLRLEHEMQFFKYSSSATMHYNYINPPINNTNRELQTTLDGHEHQSMTEFTPKVSVKFAKNGWTWSAAFSQGAKSGGYNTQLFSDILQGKMTTDWMERIGVSSGAKNDISSVISYKPEYTLNYETGFSYDSPYGLKISLLGYYIDCRDQQLTKFPEGLNTGRMMTNAGKTRSFGGEAEATYSKTFQAPQTTQRLTAGVSYGYTNARFVRYDNGKQDYSGNHLPYAPQHTLTLTADYTIMPNLKTLKQVALHIDWRANGPTYWDDENKHKQNFYGLLQAAVSATFNDKALHAYKIKLYGKNLTSEDYNTFYFVSVGNSFLQKGRPLELGVQFTLSL